MTYRSRVIPPIEAIIAALAAREHGSFTAAADALNVTHAAISRRVAVAERWAEQRLFQRHGRGVRTTLEGERLLGRLDTMLEGIDQLVDHERRSNRRRKVRIATTPSFARYRILPQLRRIEADDLSIEIVAELRNIDFRDAQIDLAIRYGQGNWQLGTETALKRSPLVPIVSRTLMGQTDPDTSTIVALPLIHNADTVLWRAWCVAHGLTRRPKDSDRRMFDYASSLAAAKTGLGVCLFDTSLHELNELDGTMVAQSKCQLNDPPLGYWAIIPFGAGDMGREVMERLFDAPPEAEP